LILFTESREADFKHLPLPEPQKTDFIHTQFQMQDNYYKVEFPKAEFSIIQKTENDIGRLIINRTAANICLVDIIIARNNQNQGIGSDLIRLLQNEARHNNCPLNLSVAQNNIAAIRLYARLGFQETEVTETYIYMAWQP